MRAPSRPRDQKHPCCVSGDQERTSAAENECQSRGCDWSSVRWALCSYTQRGLLAADRSCCERQAALGEIRGCACHHPSVNINVLAAGSRLMDFKVGCGAYEKRFEKLADKGVDMRL